MAKGEKLRKVTHPEILPVGNAQLECFVLDDGSKVLTASSIFKDFGRPKKGAGKGIEIKETKMPLF